MLRELSMSSISKYYFYIFVYEKSYINHRVNSNKRIFERLCVLCRILSLITEVNPTNYKLRYIGSKIIIC